MRTLELHDHVSFCRAAGQLVLLDVRSDRYFRLPAALGQALLEHLEGRAVPSADLETLVARGILTDEPVRRPTTRPTTLPAMSAMESSRERVTLDFGSCVEIFLLVIAGRAELRFRPLHRILESLEHAGSRRADTCRMTVRTAAARFRLARLFVPVEPRCLVDSIALTRFLRRRGFDTRMVFGVALDPFSAHCWVQSDDLVLNDSVGNVTSHTPIRAV